MFCFQPRRQSRRRGVSMAEVLLSMLVLGLAVMVFGASAPFSDRVLSTGRHVDVASDACQQQLDYYRSVGYASLPAIPSGTNHLTLSFTPPASLPEATGSVTFTRVDDSFGTTSITDTGRVRVDVTVNWTGVRADHGPITLTSLIALVPL